MEEEASQRITRMGESFTKEKHSCVAWRLQMNSMERAFEFWWAEIRNDEMSKWTRSWHPPHFTTEIFQFYASISHAQISSVNSPERQSENISVTFQTIEASCFCSAATESVIKVGYEASHKSCRIAIFCSDIVADENRTPAVVDVPFVVFSDAINHAWRNRMNIFGGFIKIHQKVVSIHLHCRVH
jgi:hypothetical protein